MIKITASKKYITLLVISILCLLLTLLFFFVREPLRNRIDKGYWLTMDTNQELLDLCQHSVGESDLVFNCNGLLEYIKVKEESEEECYAFKVIPVEGESLVDFQLCGKTDDFSWKNPYDEYTKLIPVKLGITYQKTSWWNYSFKSAGLNVMDDEEFFLLSEHNKNLRQLSDRVRTASGQSVLSYLNYYLNTSPWGDFKNVSYISLALELEDYHIENDAIILHFKGILRGSPVELRFRSKKLLLGSYTNTGEATYTVLTAENIDVLPKKSKYGMLIAYWLNSKEAFINEISKRCKEDYYTEILCENSQFLGDKSITDEYVKELTKKGEVVDFNEGILLELVKSE